MYIACPPFYIMHNFLTYVGMSTVYKWIHERAGDDTAFRQNE